MKELLETLDGWTADGVGAGRAVVVRTFGSAPRPEGACSSAPTTGGSRDPSAVVASRAAATEIERARADGRRVIRYGISDEQAWDVGLACGGTIDVLIEPLVPAVAVAGARDRGRAVATILPADAPPSDFGRHEPGEGNAPEAPITIGTDGSMDGTLGSAEADAALRTAAADALLRGTSRTVTIGDRQVFVEAFPVRPRLVIVGAVEVARSLAVFAKELGYEVVVVDGRASFATPERFPPDRVDRLVVWPDEVARRDRPRARRRGRRPHPRRQFDEPAIVEGRRRGCRYVGAGKARKTQGDRRARLREVGVTEEELARLRGPVGLDLGGRNPSETALAIIAEVVAERYGGSGTPLVDKARAAQPVAVA
jgi:xanthine dehydrogenase accessory factor